MNMLFTDESGFLSEEEKDLHASSAFTDISIFHESANGYSLLYQARRMGKRFILKTLKPEYAGHPLYRQLLQKEFEIGYQLSHPHITQTLSLEEVEGCGLCIVMEYVDGDILQAQREGQDKTNALRIITELCNALAYLHSRQIVHRDLKPANILITHHGHHVKLIDFGCSDADNYVLLKEPAGTRRYAAPELLAGSREADARMDIYSLGIILQELRPTDPAFLSVGKQCCQEYPNRRPAYTQNIPALLRTYDRRRTFRYWGIAIGILCTLSVFFLFNKYRQTDKTVPAPTTVTLPPADTSNVPTHTYSSPATPSEEHSKEGKRATHEMKEKETPIPSRIPTIADLLGAPVPKPDIVYGHDQRGFNLSNTLFMDVSDRMLAVMQQLDSASSPASLQALIQDIHTDGDLRLHIKKELYQQEETYQQNHHLHEPRYYQVIDYQLDKTYARLQGLFRPLVAHKIDSLYPPATSLSLPEEVYRRATVSAFRHYCQVIQTCDTMQADFSLTRFLIGYWKHEAREEVNTWLAERVAPESALYKQCQDIIASTINTFSEAYDYLTYRKTTEIEKHLGYPLGIVTESEERLPDGTVRKHILQDDGTWRMEGYDERSKEIVGKNNSF